MGLGMSVSVPLGFSAAGKAGGASVAGDMAAFALMSMAFSSIALPLYGGIADLASQRVAVLAFLPLAILSFAFARPLAEPPRLAVS